MAASAPPSGAAGTGGALAPPAGIRRHRFVLLLASLVLLLLLSPLLEGGPAGTLLLALLFSLVMLAAVLAASARRRTLWVALGFAIPWLYLTWLHPLWRADGTDLAASLLLIGLALFVLALVLGRVVRAERVGLDILCGALAVYLLIGVVWAVSYTVIEALSPGAFRLAAPAAGTPWNQLLYFSLTTLTTLGYGDIVPVGPFARLWSTLEAVTGTLYLAVLIARLVSLYRR